QQTKANRDWSSDMYSSDLARIALIPRFVQIEQKLERKQVPLYTRHEICQEPTSRVHKFLVFFQSQLTGGRFRERVIVHIQHTPQDVLQYIPAVQIIGLYVFPLLTGKTLGKRYKQLAPEERIRPVFDTRQLIQTLHHKAVKIKRHRHFVLPVDKQHV